jgi:MFS family permease
VGASASESGPLPTDATRPAERTGWRRIHRDVWSISVTSLFSDWSYEMVLPILPFFLTFSLGTSPLIVGLVDGAAQFAQSGVQSLAVLGRWAEGRRRKVRGSFGYLATTLGHGLLALAVAWPQVLVLRIGAWLGRGSRQPIKKAIVSNATAASDQGIAFGLEQAMDSLGAVLGTATAVGVLLWRGIDGFRSIFAVSVIPGVVAIAVLLILVQDRASDAPSGAARRTSGRAWGAFPREFRLFLLAEGVFGLGYFSILLALLRVGETLLPADGGSLVEAVVASLLLYLLYNLLFAGLSFPSGRWVDRAPGLGPVALSFALFAVVDLALIGGHGLWGGVVVFSAAGVQVALQGVAESAWIGRRVAREDAGAAFGLLGTVQGMAVLAGSLLAGALWTYRTAALAFEVSAVLSIAGAALLVPVALVARRAPRRPSGTPVPGL